MPGFNGTGPNGMGPMTGGGRGFCAVTSQSRQPFPRGRRFMQSIISPEYPGYTGRSEISSLRDMTESLNKTLKEIEERIKKLESNK